MTSPTPDPADRYATLARLKASLKLTADDRDELLAEALDVASRQLDATAHRRFWVDETPTVRTYRTADRIVPGDDGDALLVDDIAATDGLVVEYRAGYGKPWVPVTDYEVGPDNALADGRPVTQLRRWCGWHTDRVRVTARHGWPAVPAEVAMACRMQAHRLYKRKESPEGVLGSAEWGAVRVARVDPDVAALIADFVLLDA